MSMTGCHTIDDPGFRFLRLRAPFPTMTDAHTKLFRERSRIRVLGFQFSLSLVPGGSPVRWITQRWYTLPPDHPVAGHPALDHPGGGTPMGIRPPDHPVAAPY